MTHAMHHLIAGARLTLLVVLTLEVAPVARVVVLHAMSSMLHTTLHAGAREATLVSSVDVLALYIR